MNANLRNSALLIALSRMPPRNRVALASMTSKKLRMMSRNMRKSKMHLRGVRSAIAKKLNNTKERKANMGMRAMLKIHRGRSPLETSNWLKKTREHINKRKRQIAKIANKSRNEIQEAMKLRLGRVPPEKWPKKFRDKNKDPKKSLQAFVRMRKKYINDGEKEVKEWNDQLEELRRKKEVLKRSLAVIDKELSRA